MSQSPPASQDSILDSLEDLDDFTDCGSDYEAEMKIAKRKKTAVHVPQPPKRPRRKAALRETSIPNRSHIPTPRDSPLHQASRGMSRQAIPKPVTRVKEGDQGISAEDIYNAVCSGKSAMVTVVDEWLESYKLNREAGLLVLINFIVQSCGCKGVVSREMFSSMQNAEIIGNLTKEFNEDSGSYPLCTPGPQLKRFKAGLCEFARLLVRSCRNSIVYDEYLFPSLLALLTGLSDSQVRAFRHTSTLLAMKLMTGLVEVAVSLSIQLQTTQRQFDMEKNKTAPDRASERLEELQNTIHQLKENREELSSMMNATFRGVFVHRYRDRLPEIRAACIEELGVWLKTNPEDFLNDGYLKYLGWTLFDKQCPVRLQCVRALQGLYQEKEFIGRLELFTSRFKERMLSMVLDKDPDVAVEVVNLLLLIQQSPEEGLKEEECGHIYPLVYASHRGLASAAGAFIYNRMKLLITSENQKNQKNHSAAVIQMLIAFYIQSEFHEHGAYLVDSLWSVARSELKDWDSMTAMLLGESGMMDEEEEALIELMICAIRQASQATPPVGRAQGKKTLSMKDKKVQEQDRSRITTHFIPLLPQLLAKYSADAGKMTLLLKAPLYFDLEMFSSAQWLEKHLDLLLGQICGIVEKHTEAKVLEACAHLVSTLCSDCYTFSSRAQLVFSQLLDNLTECFYSYSSDLLQGTADDDDTYSAAIAMKRIAALSTAKDLTGWKLFDTCLELLKSISGRSDMETELMVAVLKCAGFHLMFAKANAVNSTPTEAELKDLKRKVRGFCRACQSCLSVTQSEIRDQAFELLCDLLLVYSVVSVRSQPDLQSLVHLPSDSLRSELAAFILDYVFTDIDEELTGKEEEMKVALLQRRRNQLVGYCKLVIYGVLDLSAATDVFKHYSKYFKDFGDIIKETISKTKLISPVLSAKTVCLTLQQLFSEMLTEERSRQDLGEIKDLAKRLALSFGIDLHRVREPLVALHMNGIRFAFRDPQAGEEQHPNVAFLEILSEFSHKLLLKDRDTLAAFMKSVCPSAALSWMSVKIYQRSLESHSTSVPKVQEGGVERTDAVSSHDSPVPKRKRTTAQAPWLESSSINSSLPTPALTSTVLRQQHKQPASSKPRPAESNVGSDFIESEDEFSSGMQMRKVKQNKRRQSSSASNQQDLNSYLSLLSLTERDNAEQQPEIEDFDSNSDIESAYTQSSMPHTTSVLDELFD